MSSWTRTGQSHFQQSLPELMLPQLLTALYKEDHLLQCCAVRRRVEPLVGKGWPTGMQRSADGSPKSADHTDSTDPFAATHKPILQSNSDQLSQLPNAIVSGARPGNLKKTAPRVPARPLHEIVLQLPGQVFINGSRCSISHSSGALLPNIRNHLQVFLCRT